MLFAKWACSTGESDRLGRIRITTGNTVMKLLVAYDGSKCAEAAIDDLTRAGLPETGTAQVISVAEVWLPPPEAVTQSTEKESAYLEEIVRHHRERGEKILAEASVKAKHAESRVRTALPNWTVTSSATYGSPAWEILSAGEDLGADLIVVGSHGLSALSRLFLGSISQKVLSEAFCSVRIARGRNEVEPGPARVVVGFDGSNGAIAAIDHLSDRSWPKDSKIRLVAATEPIAPSLITRFVPPVNRMIEDVNVRSEHWIAEIAEKELAKLRARGIDAHLHIHPGNPKDILVQEAEGWSADCVFVGANAHGGLFHGVLGSTSAAVAARAHCSVEVVRKRSVGDPSTNGKIAPVKS
jgi:nucleotide-binding universal stress UspA family protein